MNHVCETESRQHGGFATTLEPELASHAQIPGGGDLWETREPRSDGEEEHLGQRGRQTSASDWEQVGDSHTHQQEAGVKQKVGGVGLSRWGGELSLCLMAQERVPGSGAWERRGLMALFTLLGLWNICR